MTRPPVLAEPTIALAEAARRALARELVGAEQPSPAEVADGIVRAWEKLASHFARLVGKDGIRTLLERSVILARGRFAWLGSPSDGAGSLTQPSWASLRGSVVQHSDEAIDAFVVLVSVLIRLLGRFIGEDLVDRLMHELWPDAFLPNPKETE